MSVHSSAASGSASCVAKSAASATTLRTSWSIAFSSSALTPFVAQQACLDLLDRVLLLAHLLHLFLGAVFRGVGHRMSAIAVGRHLQDDRAVAAAAPFQREVGGGLDRAHVHAVDLEAGDVEALTALRQVGQRRGALDRGAHRVAVVLDDVDHRQLPQLGHVEGLVDLALVGGPVAEIGEGDVAVAAVAVGEREACAEGDLRADDAVAAVEMLLLGEHVHRAALALAEAAAASGQLGHDALGVEAAGQHVAVVAVGGDGLVAGLGLEHQAGHHRLLPDVEVAEAADQPHAVHLAGALLEAADEEHAAVGLELLFAGESDGRRCRGAECRHGVGHGRGSCVTQEVHAVQPVGEGDGATRRAA